MSTPTIPAPGFADPTRGAQQTFRRLLDAMARPGTRHTVEGPASAPEGLGQAMAGVLLTLLDEHTPMHLVGSLAEPAAQGYLAFHTGAPCVPVDQATFVMARPDELPDLDVLQHGSDEAPHESATLVIDARTAHADQPVVHWTATGPGIEESTPIQASWAPPGLLEQWQQIVQEFPRGVDIIVVADQDVLCLPRTCHLVESEA